MLGNKHSQKQKRKEEHESVEKLAVLASDGASKIEGFGRLVATTANGCKSKTWTKHFDVLFVTIIIFIVTNNECCHHQHNLNHHKCIQKKLFIFITAMVVMVISIRICSASESSTKYCAHHNTNTGTSIVQQMTKPSIQTSPIHPSFLSSSRPIASKW